VFGYRSGDSLFTHDGKEVGRFHGDEIYRRDGRYLGELKNAHRLIRQRGRGTIRSPCTPIGGVSYARQANYAANAKIAGYEDFPPAGSF
jgi:hypothetical protein